MNRFLQEFEWSDVIFIIDPNTRVYAAKTCLALASPVFNAMFSGCFVERESKEIPLPGKKLDPFLHFMELLHLPCVHMKHKFAKDIIQLSDEYQIDHIKLKAENLLVKLSLDVTDYTFAVNYNLNNLRNVLLQEIKTKGAKQLNSNEFLDIFPPNERIVIETLLDKCISSDKMFYDLVLSSSEPKKPVIVNYSVKGKGGEYTFSVDFFELLKASKFESPRFEMHGCSWFVLCNIEDEFIGIFLSIVSDKKITVKFTVSILNTNKSKPCYEKKELIKNYNKSSAAFGLSEFMYLGELCDRKEEFIEDGQITIRMSLRLA